MISRKKELDYRFHNPNTPEATADYILKILIEANQKRIERILEEETFKCANLENQKQSRLK